MKSLMNMKSRLKIGDDDTALPIVGKGTFEY
jgi:hypothetical protein